MKVRLEPSQAMQELTEKFEGLIKLCLLAVAGMFAAALLMLGVSHAH